MTFSAILATAGLILALIGSILTIGSLPLTKKQVDKLFEWGGRSHEDEILHTSRRVALGLLFVAIGTILQIVSLLVD